MALTKKFQDLINQSLLIKKTIFIFINTPPFDKIYDFYYRKQIKKKISNIKLPKYILIEPYNLCNAACTMCPYKEMTRKKELMTMNLFRKIVDDAAKNNIETIDLTFYNEAFLDPHIFERIEYIKKKHIKLNLFSNGSVLTKEKTNKLLDRGIDLINFSLDGATKNTYETIRKNLKYETVVNNIKYLIEERNRRGLKNPRVELAFIISETNQKEIERFKQQWKNIVDNIRFGIIDTRDEKNNVPKKFEVKKSKKPWACTRIWEAIQVMSNGKVVLCCVDFDGKVVVGDMKKQSIKDIWNSNKFRQLRLTHLKNQADKISICQTCSWLYRHNRVNWWFFNP